MIPRTLWQPPKRDTSPSRIIYLDQTGTPRPWEEPSILRARYLGPGDPKELDTILNVGGGTAPALFLSIEERPNGERTGVLYGWH